MNVFADTNWLEALYFVPQPEDEEASKRASVVERYMRKHSGPLLISHMVLLEARNVFSRISQMSRPAQWDELVNDFNGRIFVDPMNWDLLRQETNALFERFSHKTLVGTFDATMVASARLAGAQEILSFDERLKAVASCCEMSVFPRLSQEGKLLRAELMR